MLLSFPQRDFIAAANETEIANIVVAVNRANESQLLMLEELILEEFATAPSAIANFVIRHWYWIAGLLVITWAATYLLVSCIHYTMKRFETEQAKKLQLLYDFKPNLFAFALVCVSLGEDIGSIILVNDARHSVFYLYFWFTVFPIFDAVFGELVECFPGKIDDVLVGVLFELFQAILFLYFSDFSSTAFGFFSIAYLFQCVMIVGKACTAPETPISGLHLFLIRYRWPLGSMFAFSILQFSLALKQVELSFQMQLLFTFVPWAVGLTLSLDLPEETMKNLSDAGIDDKDMQKFADAIGKGSLRALTQLDLHHNQIGDLGMIKFSRSIAIGSLRSLESLDLAYNQIGDAGMIELSRQIPIGSLRGLRYLNLSFNQIGDVGMIEFSRSIPIGSLGALRELYLHENQIGDEGMKAFSTAISSGSMKLTV